MLKASREAVPEGKPLDPTLLHDGFLRVNNKKKKHIQKLNPKLYCLRVYFCLHRSISFSLRRYFVLIRDTVPSKPTVKNIAVSKIGVTKYSKLISR